MRYINKGALVLAGTVILILFLLSIEAIRTGRAHYVPRFMGGAAFISFLALGIWLRERQIKKDFDSSLNAYRDIEFDDALAKAAESSTALPQGLVIHKVQLGHLNWGAFEKHSFQFVVYLDPITGKSQAKVF